jgi:cation diffusion facilitator CzcD-associated flavoprotein CzcO
MKRRLAQKPELADTLMPSFPPVCRRLTPGPGYLEALTDPKTDVIATEIKEVIHDGIITSDGQHRPVDAIVCATGFDTTFSPRFPIIGRNGVSLAEKWKDVPATYLSITTDDFPNYFISLGPNSALGTGNLLLLIERAIDYMTACLSKMQRDNVRSMAPKADAVKSFVDFCDSYFQTTVFSMNCRSWYKGGTADGRVSALWPGKKNLSRAHSRLAS